MWQPLGNHNISCNGPLPCTLKCNRGNHYCRPSRKLQNYSNTAAFLLPSLVRHNETTDCTRYLDGSSQRTGRDRYHLTRFLRVFDHLDNWNQLYSLANCRVWNPVFEWIMDFLHQRQLQVRVKIPFISNVWSPKDQYWGHVNFSCSVPSLRIWLSRGFLAFLRWGWDFGGRLSTKKITMHFTETWTGHMIDPSTIYSIFVRLRWFIFVISPIQSWGP